MVDVAGLGDAVETALKKSSPIGLGPPRGTANGEVTKLLDVVKTF